VRVDVVTIDLGADGACVRRIRNVVED